MAKVELIDIPQGASSGMDSDTIDGLQTSSYASPSPNTLVPIGPDGQLPASVVPVQSTSFTLLETQSPVVSSSVLFTAVLLPDTYYKVTYSLAQNTALGILQVRFNGDSGANYSYGAVGTNIAGGLLQDNAGGATEARLNPGTGSGDYHFGDFDFSTVPGDNTIVFGTSRAAFDSGANIQYSFKYDGASSLSSVTVLVSAGTITGTFKLYEVS